MKVASSPASDFTPAAPPCASGDRPDDREAEADAARRPRATDADGHAAYEAHMTDEDGMRVTVYVDEQFEVVSVESGR